MRDSCVTAGYRVSGVGTDSCGVTCILPFRIRQLSGPDKVQLFWGKRCVANRAATRQAARVLGFAGQALLPVGLPYLPPRKAIEIRLSVPLLMPFKAWRLMEVAVSGLPLTPTTGGFAFLNSRAMYSAMSFWDG